MLHLIYYDFEVIEESNVKTCRGISSLKGSRVKEVRQCFSIAFPDFCCMNKVRIDVKFLVLRGE